MLNVIKEKVLYSQANYNVGQKSKTIDSEWQSRKYCLAESLGFDFQMRRSGSFLCGACSSYSYCFFQTIQKHAARLIGDTIVLQVPVVTRVSKKCFTLVIPNLDKYEDKLKRASWAKTAKTVLFYGAGKFGENNDKDFTSMIKI